MALSRIRLLCTLTLLLPVPSLLSQGLSPSSPSKEFVRFGSRVLAVDRGGSSTVATPSSATVTPASGSTDYVAMAVNVYNSSGYTNTEWIQTAVNNTLTSVNSCYTYFNRPANLLYLMNDAGTQWLTPVQPGSVGTYAENSRCRVDGGGTSFSGEGTNAKLSIKFSFSIGFAGSKNSYVAAGQPSGSYGGWWTTGTWSVPSTGQIPRVMSVAPANGSGSAGTFRISSVKNDGLANTKWIQLIINNTLSASYACHIYYDQLSNSILLNNDTATNWVGSGVIGSGTVLENSQCRILLAQSSRTSAYTTADLNVRIEFKSGFAGGKTLYATSGDFAENYVYWSNFGTWYAF